MGQLHINKLDNLEVHIILGTYSLWRLNHKEIENINRPVTTKEFEVIIKCFLTKKSPGTHSFIDELYQTFKENFMPPFQTIVKNQRRGSTNSFCDSSIPLTSNSSQTGLIWESYRNELYISVYPIS